MRKQYEVISCGDYQPLLTDHEHIFAYQRTLKDTLMTVLCNFCGVPVTFSYRLVGYKLILCNLHCKEIFLANLLPYEARVSYKG